MTRVFFALAHRMTVEELKSAQSDLEHMIWNAGPANRDHNGEMHEANRILKGLIARKEAGQILGEFHSGMERSPVPA